MRASRLASWLSPIVALGDQRWLNEARQALMSTHLGHLINTHTYILPIQCEQSSSCISCHVGLNFRGTVGGEAHKHDICWPTAHTAAHMLARL